MKFTLLADLQDVPGFAGEFGLSFYLEYNRRNLLFDTGADRAFLTNAAKLGLNINALPVIISHGHYDHSGGLQYLAPECVWCVPGADRGHYSLHDDGTIHHISMPEAAQQVLNNAPVLPVNGFTEIADGLYLTGAIPRTSGEDCGGKFFQDEQCLIPDEVAEEQALLTAGGILLSGCCHAGIINTMEYCRMIHPEITIHTVIGGLHLRKADNNRLRQTAEYLRSSGVKQLFLLHCTGENAIDFLRQELPGCAVETVRLGSTLTV